MNNQPGDVGHLGLIETHEGYTQGLPPPPPPPPADSILGPTWDFMPVATYYGTSAVTINADYWLDDLNNSYQIRILRRPDADAEIGLVVADREEIDFTYDDFSLLESAGIMYLVVTPQGSVTDVTAEIHRVTPSSF